FLNMRAMPNPDYNFRFDNVVFALNVIDQVAGDERFLRIRTRKPQHSTLRLIEDEIARTRERESDQIKEYQAKFDKQIADIEESSKKRRDEFAKQVEVLQKKQDEEGQLDPSLIMEFQEK